MKVQFPGEGSIFALCQLTQRDQEVIMSPPRR
jgi:hypothetical protein